jgi:2-dehydropantoate 2-reductase
MRVLVMGAGAVGGYYGAILAGRGHDVTLVARGAHLRALQDRGLTVRDGDRSRGPLPVRAVGSPGDAPPGPELVLFTVKGYDTEQAARALAPALGPATAVLTLQNGIDGVERLAAVLGPAPVLAGTTVIEATVPEPGLVVRLGLPPRIVLGEPDGPPSARAEAIAAAFRDAGVPAEVVPDIRRALWEKFVRLAPGATLTSACQAPIGTVRDDPAGAALYRRLVEEAVAVGRAAGVDLGPHAADQALGFIWSLPATMRTSMQRDFERGGPVELEPLTGAVVREGRRRGVPTPAFDALYAVLRVRAAGRVAPPAGGAPAIQEGATR